MSTITAADALRDKYQNDIRFRKIVDYAVSGAMAETRQIIDRDDISLRDVHEVATLAAAAALRAAFEGDAEIHAAHIERDHYKKIAESVLMHHPLTMTIPKPD